MGRTSRACVFDMDGVLIDTEPVWRQVELDVFARVGVALTDDQLRDTWGMRIEEVVDHWYQQRPWNGIRPQAVQREIIREMVEYVRRDGVPMVGALEAIDTARSAGLRIAIASSASSSTPSSIVSTSRSSSMPRARLTTRFVASRIPASTSALRRRSTWCRRCASPSRTHRWG